MRNPSGTVLLTGFIIVLLTNIPQALSEGVFELNLLTFDNLHGRDVNGVCCDGDSATDSGSCATECHTMFRICLKQYQNSIDPNPPCIYGSKVTNVLGGKSIDFASSDSVSLKQPVTFPFTIAWPGTFTLIVEAWHKSQTSNSMEKGAKQLLLRYAEAKTMTPKLDWTTDVRGANGSSLKIQYRVVCAPNNYGDKCMAYCRPKDDEYGHYDCDANGVKRCKLGWQGQFCDKPVCREGCDPVNGRCERAGECVCKLGYTGDKCDRCIKYPGCRRGTCHKPFECNCEEGWGGMFCNQDLNFCTHHHPCLHGSTCTNTGRGHYTCTCRPGFTGTNCEIRIQDCTQQPCLNGGYCKEMTTNYSCECLDNFSGRHCQISATRCVEEPCQNGATCLDRADYGDGAGGDAGGGYTCICPEGWQGPNCDTERNECQNNPCLNGGRCVEKFNGYQCVCDVGFEGARCDININDCTENACLNGGTCLDGVSDFKCQCASGWTGKLCQENFDDCIKRPCANGGTCFDLTDDYRCMCRPGFTGRDCSIDVNECASSPCRNGAACTDLIDDYECACRGPPGCFGGKNCHVRNDDCRYAQTFAPHLVAYNSTPPAIMQDRDDALHMRGKEDEGETRLQDAVIAFGVPLVVLFFLVVLLLLVIIFILYRRSHKPANDDGGLERRQNLRNELRCSAATSARYQNNNNTGIRPPLSPCKQLVVPNSYLEFQKPKVDNVDRDYALQKKKNAMDAENSRDDDDNDVGGGAADPRQQRHRSLATMIHAVSINENPGTYRAALSSTDKTNSKKQLLLSEKLSDGRRGDTHHQSRNQPPPPAPLCRPPPFPPCSTAMTTTAMRSDFSKDSGLGSPSSTDQALYAAVDDGERRLEDAAEKWRRRHSSVDDDDTPRPFYVTAASVDRLNSDDAAATGSRFCPATGSATSFSDDRPMSSSSQTVDSSTTSPSSCSGGGRSRQPNQTTDHRRPVIRTLADLKPALRPSALPTGGEKANGRHPTLSSSQPLRVSTSDETTSNFVSEV